MRRAICIFLVLAMALTGAAAFADQSSAGTGGTQSEARMARKTQSRTQARERAADDAPIINFDRIGKALADGADAVKEQAQAVWADLQPEVDVWRAKAGEALEAGKQVFADAFERARAQAGAWWEQAPGALQSAGNTVAEGLGEAGKKLGDAWETAKPGLEDAGRQAGDAISSGLTKAWDGLSSLWK